MNGLQTIQKINDAAIHFARAKANTPVADVVEGFFVFEPNGYEVIYHTADKLPDGSPFFAIEFKGEDSRGARFDVSNVGITQCNRSLDEVVQIAAQAGLDSTEVAGRLGRLFVSINRN